VATAIDTVIDQVSDPGGAPEPRAAGGSHAPVWVGTSVAPSIARYATPEDVFRAHYRRLVRVLSLVVGPEVAADVVQDAFVELYVRWDRIAAYEDQAAWVRRVAINRSRNHHRSAMRRAQAVLRLGSREVPGGARPSFASSEAVGLDVAAAIRLLPDRQRTAIALYYIDDLPVEAVAHAMGISEGAVSRHLHRGREALRRSLEVT
jgi:RNA polymerase sigma-70 factor (ECF subfamily)